MNNIYAITTHHETPIEAADAWMKCGLCAIGFIEQGNLQKADPNRLSRDTRLFLEIGVGDFILAYATRNMIAYVGEILDGKYIFDADNEIGSHFGYPNQFRVRWWSEPKHFKRTDLPPLFSEQLGKRGRTVVRLDLGSYSFAKAMAVIKACANTGSADSELNEEMIKAGLHNFLVNHLDFLEPGLRIVKAEEPITPESRPDFVGFDAKNRKVLIECKGMANAAACDQLMRYKAAYGGRPRLLLVAFRMDEACKKQAKKEHIELIECTLNVRRLS